MKRLFEAATTTVLYIGLTLTGCGSADNTFAMISGATTSGITGQSDSPEITIGDKKTIYFVSLKVGGAAWSQAQQGFEDTCKELGRDGYYVVPTTADDSSQVANLCETAVTSSAGAILGPLFGKGISTDIIGRTHEQGMLVGAVSTYLDGIKDFNIGTDQKNMGAIQAEALIDLVGDNPCKVVWMTMNTSSVNIMETYDAFCQAPEGRDSIFIHGIKLDGNDPTMAADKVNNLWRANPAINAIIYNDSSDASLDIPNFIEENNLQDELYSIGIDVSADILNYAMIGGLDCTLDQNFYKMSYESIYMLKDVWDGKGVEKKVDSSMNCVIGTGAVEYGASRGCEVATTAK